MILDQPLINIQNSQPGIEGDTRAFYLPNDTKIAIYASTFPEGVPTYTRRKVTLYSV
jgi:hypothetical protein